MEDTKYAHFYSIENMWLPQHKDNQLSNAVTVLSEPVRVTVNKMQIDDIYRHQTVPQLDVPLTMQFATSEAIAVLRYIERCGCYSKCQSG
jgi:hypothetical protein